MVRSVIFAPLFSGLLLLTACAVGSPVTKEQAPTLGQELTDLKVAFDSGALTEEEYQAAKEKLLESN